MARSVAVVPHTHWDREWYEPFQTFRLRLVALLDDLLARMDADASVPAFLLDGQVAMVDDYLAVRPEAEGRLRRLVEEGRLAIGPWYVLPDEFLVSPETLIRNLELGRARAAELGGAMEVGYLPDMFGHVAQMPQLLRLGGFSDAVVWRGVPAAIDRTAFRWTSPDGSTVRAEYLPVGYGNGAAVPEDAGAFVDRVRAHERELEDLLGDGDPILWMNGSDHQLPQPWLARVVAEAGDGIRLTTLPRYLAEAPSDDLPSWTGELRSGARANLLPGVTSNRVDVKQAAAKAARQLERLAEPLSALFLPAAAWPGAMLGLAWKEVVRNAAHDSICACSADEVVDTVLRRYAEASQIGAGLAATALGALSDALPVAGPVAVNPSHRSRSGLVELIVDGDGTGEHVLDARPAAIEELTVTGAELGKALAHITHRAMTDGAVLTALDVQEGEDGALEAVSVRTGPARARSADTTSVLCGLYAKGGAFRERPVRVRVDHDPFARVLRRAVDVPGFGWAPPARTGGWPVRTGPAAMTNGLVTVEVDADDGTFSVDGLPGFNRLVDGGDEGDTYNWSPPAYDKVVDTPEAVEVSVVEPGPLRGVLEVRRTYNWPERIVDRARSGAREVVVDTRLELHAGEKLVRITTSFENPCRDHRLRVHFPLPREARTSTAECAFAVVERGLNAEGGPTEQAIPTFPSRRFVQAGGLIVVHDGLHEYEIVDMGRAVALTLLRCVGLLSGTDLATRPLPAGPPVPVEGAQMQGRQVLRYAVSVDPHVDPYPLADDAFLPLLVVHGSGGGGGDGGGLAETGSALDIDGAEVSSVRRVEGGALEVRVFNPTGDSVVVSAPGAAGVIVDLRGQTVGQFRASFSLRPWEILTLRLDTN